MGLKRKYEQARHDPGSRPWFVRHLTHYNKYFSSISYAPVAPEEDFAPYPYKNIAKPKTNHGATVMEVQPTELAEKEFVIGTKSRAFIYDAAFDYSFEEFLTALAIHEQTHAREYFESPKLIVHTSQKILDMLKDPLVKTLTEIKADIADVDCEMRAYSAELDTPWTVSKSYRKDLQYMIMQEKRCRKELVALYNDLMLDAPGRSWLRFLR